MTKRGFQMKALILAAVIALGASGASALTSTEIIMNGEILSSSKDDELDDARFYIKYDNRLYSCWVQWSRSACVLIKSEIVE